MNVRIELYTTQKIPLYSDHFLAKIAHEVIRIANIVPPHVKTISLSVAIVDEKEICRANRLLRQKDIVTDVLSVGEYSDKKDIAKATNETLFLGEVILCYNYIKQSAHKENKSVEKEFFITYAHGILHLLGFSHGEKMFQLQDAIGTKFSSNKINYEKSPNRS